MPSRDPEVRKKRNAEWYQRNRELHLVRSRRYNAKPETKAKKHADYLANKEKRLAQNRERRRKNPDCRKGEWARLKQRDPDRVKSHQLWTAYGIRLADYNRMLAAQGDVCAICKEPNKRKYFDVDHDHISGAVRGLLCRTCNTAVGYLEHLEPYHLKATREYLETTLTLMA